MKNKLIILAISFLVLSVESFAQVKKETKPYRYSMGKSELFLKKTYFNFGNLPNTQSKSDTTPFVSRSDTSVSVKFKNVPKYVTVKVVPEIVKPKESGYIVVTYNAKLDVNNKGESNWGSRSKRMYLIINGDVAGSRKNGINVRANLVEDFSHLTKRQLAKAPKISFDTLVYNFGTITQGDVVKHDFVYKNLGKNPLFIRKVKGS